MFKHILMLMEHKHGSDNDGAMKSHANTALFVFLVSVGFSVLASARKVLYAARRNHTLKCLWMI